MPPIDTAEARSAIGQFQKELGQGDLAVAHEQLERSVEEVS